MPSNTKYIVNGAQLTDIGAAIRSKLGEQDTYTVDEMPEKISEISGGGSSNEEYIILPEAEYYIEGNTSLPLISPLPEPFPREITVKMDNTSYIFEWTNAGDEGYIYSNSDIDNLFFAADSGLLYALPGSGESYLKTLEISVRREPRNYSIFTVTLVNATQIGTIYEQTADFDDFISDPLDSFIYYLDNGEIKNVSTITIPPETSLTLDIILTVDEFGQFFQPLAVSGRSSNLVNCTLNQSHIIFPEIFGAIINASGTITFEGAR